MSKKNGVCMAFDHALCISAWGSINPCCSTSADVSQLTQEINLVEYWKNDKHLNDLREEEYFGSEWLYPCDTCERKSRNGLISRKDKFTRLFPIYQELPLGSVVHFDINLGNLCNQQCIMCNSNYSSKWLKDDIEFYQNNSNEEVLKNRPEMLKFQNTSLSDKHIEELLELVTPETKMVELKGGEPLYNKNAPYFLRSIRERAPAAIIIITTNGTRIGDDNIIELLNELNDARLLAATHVSVSIDGTGKLYEWIRGWEWDSIVHSIRTYLSRSTNKTFRLSYTSTIHNMNGYEDYYKFVLGLQDEFPEKEFIVNFSQMSTSPRMCSPLIASKERKLRAMQQLKNISSDQSCPIAGVDLFQRSVKSILNYYDKSLSYVRTNKDQYLTEIYHERMVKIRGWDFGKEYLE